MLQYPVMRILIISNYYPPCEIGGWEQLTRDVALALQARGHHLFVLTSNYRAATAPSPGPTDPGLMRRLHLESPDHVHYQPSNLLRHWRWEQENRLNLRSLVAKWHPDLIFINGMWNLPVSVAQEAEHLRPGKVVYYLASYWPTELSAHTAYWTSQLKGWKKPLGLWINRLLIRSQPRSALQFARVLCVSGFMRDYLCRETAVNPAHVHIVHNGIDPTLYPMRLPQSSESLKLLYAGRLSPDKGVHTAVEAFALFCQQNPSTDATLTIAGNGAESYSQKLRQLAQPVGEKVQFLGHVPSSQMPALFQAHNLFLFPSIWAEPLARVVQEAMASGLVVLGTTTGGTPEILQDGVNGLTFAAEDSSALAEKITLLAKERERMPLLARNGRSTVEAHFTFERMIDELEAHFRQMS